MSERLVLLVKSPDYFRIVSGNAKDKIIAQKDVTLIVQHIYKEFRPDLIGSEVKVSIRPTDKLTEHDDFAWYYESGT